MGARVSDRPAHIIPVMLGDASRTMRVSERLLDASVFVQGIRPPTVPPGTARLRVTLMSTHTPDDLAFALAALQRALSDE